MNKRRLLKLAGLLEADAANPKGLKFDLETWGDSQKTPGVNCGTAACAMGLAALSGAFRREGLRARIEPPRFEGDVFAIVPTFGRSEGVSAAANLFGIIYSEAERLFIHDYYDGPKKGKRGERAVAKRIRDFVAGKALPS